MLKIGIIIFVVLILFLQGIANAGFQVDPFIVEVMVSPEEVNEFFFTVSNVGENPVNVTVEPEEWALGSIDFHEWLVIDPKEFELKGREVKKVKYKINVLKDATGELMCMVFFVFQEKGKGASNIGVRYGVPIYAVIKGTGNLDVVIESIDINYDKEKQVFNGEILIDNRSNVHIRPEIRVSIYSEKGEIVAGFKLPYKQPVQREQKRPFIFSKEMVLGPGKYKVIIKADCGKLYSIDKVIQGEKDFIIEEDLGASTISESPLQESSSIGLPAVSGQVTK